MGILPSRGLIPGALTHQGSTVGLYNVAPIARAAAIGQLIDNSGGTADSTLIALSAVYVQSEVRNNIADLAAKVNAIEAALKNIGISG